MNIDKYLNSQTNTSEGCVYKDPDAFTNNPKAICYIPEYGLDELMESREIGEDLTDTDIVERGIGETRETICSQIIDELHERDVDVTEEQVIEKGLLDGVFNALDWCCLSTYLDNSDIDDFFEEG